MFSEGVGTTLFILLMALAAWGVVRALRWGPGPVSFLLLWMWTPPVLLLLLSYAIVPVFVAHYALASVVALLILASIGICELGSTAAGSAALAIVIALEVPPIQSYFRSSRNQYHVQWDEAARLASASLKPNELAIVEPDWAISVVRYYLRKGFDGRCERADLKSLARTTTLPSILIESNRAYIDDRVGVKLFEWAAPDIIGQMRGVSVRRFLPERISALRHRELEPPGT